MREEYRSPLAIYRALNPLRASVHNLTQAQNIKKKKKCVGRDSSLVFSHMRNINARIELDEIYMGYTSTLGRKYQSRYYIPIYICIRSYNNYARCERVYLYRTKNSPRLIYSRRVYSVCVCVLNAKICANARSLVFLVYLITRL